MRLTTWWNSRESFHSSLCHSLRVFLSEVALCRRCPQLSGAKTCKSGHCIRPGGLTWCCQVVVGCGWLWRGSLQLAASRRAHLAGGLGKSSCYFHKACTRVAPSPRGSSHHGTDGWSSFYTLHLRNLSVWSGGIALPARSCPTCESSCCSHWFSFLRRLCFFLKHLS